MNGRRDELTDQLSYVSNRFETYGDFAEADLTEVIDEDLLREAATYKITELRSSVFYNDGDTFIKKELPIQSQFSPIQEFMIRDLNGDSFPDVITVGNFFNANIQRGR